MKDEDLIVTPAKVLDYDVALEGIEQSLEAITELDSDELIELTAKRALAEANRAMTIRPDNAATAAHVATVIAKVKPILKPPEAETDWDQEKVMELWSS